MLGNLEGANKVSLKLNNTLKCNKRRSITLVKRNNNYYVYVQKQFISLIKKN